MLRPSGRGPWAANAAFCDGGHFFYFLGEGKKGARFLWSHVSSNFWGVQMDTLAARRGERRRLYKPTGEAREHSLKLPCGVEFLLLTKTPNGVALRATPWLSKNLLLLMEREAGRRWRRVVVDDDFDGYVASFCC